MSTTLISLKIEQDLLDEVKIIAESKYPLRKINSYAEAVREALHEFVKKNKKYSVKVNPQKNLEIEQSS